MDSSRFDELTRSLVTSRRGALRTLAGGIVAGLIHTRPVAAQDDDETTDREAEREAREAEREAEQAAREAEREAREAEREAEQAAREAEREAEQAAREEERAAAADARAAFHRAGRSCSNGQSCGSQAPCTSGVCTPVACNINNQIVAAGALNPDNECQFCQPSASEWESWSGSVADGSSCTEATEDPCLSVAGTCVAGQCVPEPFPDESPCGADRVCCSGACCDPGECCGENGACIECGPQCYIDGVYYQPGVNPNHDCFYCDPDQSPNAWLPVDDGTTCGTIAGRVCCNGDCCSPIECCNPTGFCEECGPHCRIGTDDVPEGRTNDDNECQFCDPDANLVGWTNFPPGTGCGLGGGRDCCHGVCCPQGNCCDENGSCSACPCSIGNREYANGVEKPGNSCEYCNSFLNPNDWTPRPGTATCGASDNRSCCNGDCCPEGECCVNGACGRCPCRIGTQNVPAGNVNLSNTCQQCVPEENRDDWTIISDGGACGTDLDRECCSGDCCPIGYCCEDGACQLCECRFDTGNVPAGTINDDNVCLKCDPVANLDGWTPVQDGTACGDDGTGRCCEGDCCSEDQCCLLGACGTCLCHIDGTNYADDRDNPLNDCQYCDPEQDEFAWTERPDDHPCGSEGACCNGNCCDDNRCCVLGVCQFCGCLIGEGEYDEFQVNPGNDCQICDPVLDPFNWSPRSDVPCGDDQVCCGGVCCEQGECCGLSDVCEPCRCFIDGEYHDEGPHPDNDCLTCDVSRSPISWSISDSETCGESGDLECCFGACCAADQCCDQITQTCVTCDCVIDDRGYATGDQNPLNKCETCDPQRSEYSWSIVLFGICGENDDLECCDGVCCEEGECCTTGLSCEECACIIDGTGYAADRVNPINECQVCDPDRSTDSWSGDSNRGCGENADRVCCGGECCEAERCCDPETETCGECDCIIDGRGYLQGDRDPLALCEICNPEESTEAWTPASGISCGLDGDRTCCGGNCCPIDQCCDDEAEICGECDCLIDGRGYLTGAVNPDNACQICEPGLFTEEWTPLLRGACGENGELQCCDGICCLEGQCCADNLTCIECGCIINGRGYAPGAVNPAADCQICKPEVSETSWSTADDNFGCGDTPGMVCCNGTCTDCECQTTEELVSAAGTIVCHPPCFIEGVEYRHGAQNPENLCEACDSTVDETAWTDAPFLTKCGENGDRICCHGTCCETGDCCRPSFAYCSIEWCGIVDPCPYIEGPCGCTIDGQFYAHDTVNPANECQQCDAYWSTTSWSPSPLLFKRCGEFGDQFCCHGTCCETGSCCNDERTCEFGAPGCDDCVIGGRYYRDGTRNDDNPCLRCDAEVSKTSWTPSANGISCGEMVDDDGAWYGFLYCCEGVCCEEWYTCCGAEGICGFEFEVGPCQTPA